MKESFSKNYFVNLCSLGWVVYYHIVNHICLIGNLFQSFWCSVIFITPLSFRCLLLRMNSFFVCFSKFEYFSAYFWPFIAALLNNVSSSMTCYSLLQIHVQYIEFSAITLEKLGIITVFFHLFVLLSVFTKCWYFYNV